MGLLILSCFGITPDPDWQKSYRKTQEDAPPPEESLPVQKQLTQAKSKPKRKNRWNIPEWLEKEVRDRDTHCIYCRIKMTTAISSQEPRTSLATWEHIVNDAKLITRENIALCCNSCNASKGSKLLIVWLKSDYCKKKSIDTSTVAEVVKQALVSNWLSSSSEE